MIKLYILCFTIHQVIGFFISPRSNFHLNQPFMSVTELRTMREFERTLKDATKLCLVDFSKNKCNACARVKPKFESLSEKFEAVEFFSVEGDFSPESLDVLKSQNVRSVPTFILYLNGERIDAVQGGRIDEVEELILSSLPPPEN